jgi:plastin-1
MEDNEAYPCLLNVLAPECSAKPSPMSVKDLLHRARLVIEHADRMGCKRYLALKDIVWFTKSKSRLYGSYFFQNLKFYCFNKIHVGTYS